MSIQTDFQEFFTPEAPGDDDFRDIVDIDAEGEVEIERWLPNLNCQVEVRYSNENGIERCTQVIRGPSFPDLSEATVLCLVFQILENTAANKKLININSNIKRFDYNGWTIESWTMILREPFIVDEIVWEKGARRVTSTHKWEHYLT